MNVHVAEYNSIPKRGNYKFIWGIITAVKPFDMKFNYCRHQ